MGADISGGIVGMATGEEGASLIIENCHVYLERRDAPGLEASLIGGGILGLSSYLQTRILGSSASVPVRAIDYVAHSGSSGYHGVVGGLAGILERGEIYGSYAAGELSGVMVGGLVGGNNVGGDEGTGDVHVECSYAAGTVLSASSTAAGICASDITLGDVYAAVRYSAPFPPEVYGAAPGESGGGALFVTEEGMSYAPGQGSGVTAAELAGYSFSSGKLRAGTGEENPTYAVMPYNLSAGWRPLGPEYPYPMLWPTGEGPMIHRGDWLE